MKCSSCKSVRILRVDAKCSDCCSVEYLGQEHQGYVPGSLGIGGGDYIEMNLCLECGRLQGEFPIKDSQLPNELTLPD